MDREKALKLIIRILLVASIFIPLVFYKYLFYPFITSKALTFRLLVEIGFVCFVLYFFFKKKINYRLSPIWWWFLFLTGVILLSGFFGVSPYNSFWSNVERAEGGVFWIHLFIYFSLLVFTFTTKKDFRLLFRTSLIVALLVVLYGLMQTYGLFGTVTTSGARMSSTLGNAAYLGSFLLINVFFALYLLILDSNLYWRIFYVVSAALSFVAIFMTQTRGAMLGILGGLSLTALLIVIRSKNRQIKMYSAVVVILVIVFISSIFVFKDSNFIQSNDSLRKIASISLEDQTTKTRLVAWQAAVEGFKDQPVLGWGNENYNRAFSVYFPPEIYVNSSSKLWFDRAHSIFFEYLVTTGLVGVVTYFGLLVLSIFYLFKNKNLGSIEQNLFVGLLAGYTFANLFVFDTINTYILFAVVLAYISNSYYLNREPQEIKFEKLPAVVAVIVLLALVPLSFKINYIGTIGNRQLLEAQSYVKSDMPEEAYHFYLQAIEGDHYGKFESRREFVLFVLYNYNNFPNYQQSEMFDKAIEAIKKSIAEDPSDIRHIYNLNQLYLKSYNLDPSRLDEIIESGPIMIELGETRAHTYYQVGEAYYRKGDYENALLQYQKAVSINPGVIEGYINIFVVSVVTGNEELEQETVIKMLELNPDFFNGESILLQFVPMFKKVDRTDRVISDLKKLIVIDPNKIDYHTSLAIQYAELGRNNEAREAINVLSGADLALDEMIADFLKKLDSGELIKK